MIFMNFFSKFLSYLEGKVSISITSSEITPCNFSHFTASSCPSVIFLSRDKDENGNSFINNRYVCKEIQRRRGEYRMTFDENILFLLNMSSSSSSGILNICSPSDLI